MWISLSSDTASSEHMVGSLQDEATTRILEPLDDVACYFFIEPDVMCARSFVPFVYIERLACSAVLVNSCRLHSSLKQCILLVGRCFLVLLLLDRLRLSLLLVVLFRMSSSIKQKSMIAHIVCAPLFIKRLAYCAIFLSQLSFTYSSCCFPLLFCCCFLPRLLPCR